MMCFDVLRRVVGAWLAITLLALLGSVAAAAQPGTQTRGRPLKTTSTGAAIKASAAAPDDDANEDSDDGQSTPDDAQPNSDDEPDDADSADAETPLTEDPADQDSVEDMDAPTDRSAPDESPESDDANSNSDMPAQPPTSQDSADSQTPDQPDAAPERRPFDWATIIEVRPGHTSRKLLHFNWGLPKRIEKLPGGDRETYEIGPFTRVRVVIVDGMVVSLAARLEEAMPLEIANKGLQIGDIEPVEVLDEREQLVGHAYPERGILLGFVPGAESPRVFQIVVEPVEAELFLARAEVRLQSRYGGCLSDAKRALELAPDSGQAHALRAAALFGAGNLQQALRAAAKAVELEPEEWTFRLTLAKALAEVGDYPQAIQQIRDVVDQAPAASLVSAQAYCLWGDCVAASAERDYPQAMKHHQLAIQLARPLADSRRVAERRAAKELLILAHLAVAHDIGWGRWQQQAETVAKWIDQAEMLVADGPVTPELRLRVNEQALSALSGIGQPPDASRWIRAVRQIGQAMIAESQDPAYTAHLAWHLALALNDAAEIETVRNRPDKALALGKAALAYFEQGDQAGKQWPTHDFLRGRLFYRMGAIVAVGHADHKQAVTWYDRAVPLLESPVPEATIDAGKQGETYVSMAVSYWEVKNRGEALRLTNQGVKLMEQAARDGLLSKAALSVPYGNLASMHEQLGNMKEARKYAGLAGRQQQCAPK